MNQQMVFSMNSMNMMAVSAPSGAETASCCPSASAYANHPVFRLDTMLVVSIFVILLAVLGLAEAFITLISLILLVLVVSPIFSRSKEQPHPISSC